MPPRPQRAKWCIASGKISVAPPQHGWTLAAALLVCGAVYVGLGVAHGSRTGGKKPGLALHPSCGDISIKPGGYGGLGVGGKPTTEREQRLAGGR